MKTKEAAKREAEYILLVEDSPTQALQLQHILEQQGYRVAVAKNGQAALTAMSERKPTMVISDIVMPAMDGYQLCRQIKATEHLKDIPMILLTTLSDPQDVVRGLECGADAFIMKPYDEHDLLARIQYFLANRELRQNEQMQMGVQIFFAGQKHFITSDRLQILNLLLSVYESAVQKNRELLQAQEALQKLNEELEARVAQRTAALTREVAERQRVEEALRKAHDELELRVAHRTAELTVTNATLQAEISERKRAEEATRRNEELYRTLARNFPNGAVFLLDHDLRYVIAEGTGLAEVGLSKELLEGKTIWEVWPPEVREVIIPHCRAALAGTPTVTEVSYANRTYLMHMLPIRNEPGDIFAAMAVTQDITQRKEVERLKDEFISTVSHELRTPLTSLRGFAWLMLNRDIPAEKQREFLTIIHNEAIRLTNLINDFLDLQRMEAGRQPYNFQGVDLGQLLREAAGLFTREGEKYQMQLALPDSLLPVQADADHLHQVLTNLLSNAVKFSPQGGVITVGARQEKTNVVVWVADQGVGIPPEAMPKLFSKFFRVENQETRQIGGTGLGLALVKEIVEAHGGRVWADSEPGVGSTFSFTLPIVDRIPQPLFAATAESKKPADIVLVEDDQAYARLLQEHFESTGLSVVMTAYAEQAVELVRRFSPRLVLVDIHLAGQRDGWDVLVALKSDPMLHAIPVLIISVSENANERGLALAGADYLLKPVSPDWLRQAVRQRLSSLSGKRILVVDDEADFRRYVAHCLATEGDIQVDEAANSQEALAYLAQHMPDLLLLDLRTPEVDGFEVLRRLRADKQAMNLPVLVVTGKDLTADEKEYIRQRLAGLVSKREANLSYLAQAVKHILNA